MQFNVAGPLAALERALHRAMPGYCAFCLGKTAPGKSWCLPCYRELAWQAGGCRVCAEPLGGRTAICRHCREHPPAFDRVQAPLLYRGAVTRLVQDFKFQASPRAGILLCELFVSALGPCDAQALLPVPLHPDRARERGFNQSQWLAERLGSRLQLPVAQALRRVDTPSQRALSRPARFANMDEAFTLPRALPARVAIVDDVVTTGATVNALARAARRAGARRVTIYALARTSLALS